jgi:hypothetical protein
MTLSEDSYFPAYSANDDIWLQNFDEASQKRMRKAIINARKAAVKHDDESTDGNARHLFREFIPIAILNKNGFSFEYEKEFDNKEKPDWVENKANILVESFTYERGGSTPFINRVWERISEKCSKYDDIVIENSYRFVIAIYIDFLSDITLDDIREAIEMFRPVFSKNKSLSAILFFTEDIVKDKYQHYDFFCLSADTSFNEIQNWPFITKYL